eukprot:g3459.t1
MLGLRRVCSQACTRAVRTGPSTWRGFAAAAAEAADASKEKVEEEETVENEGGEEEKEESNGEGSAKEEIEGLQQKVDSLQKKYMESLAEMENVRRIAKRDVDQANTYSIQKFAKSLLDVADDLTRATENVKEEDVEASQPLQTFLEGVRMTENQLTNILSSNGINKFGEVGEKFDPSLHDAMYEFDDPEQEPGTIGNVIKIGYTFKDRILRPAQVGTVKKR